MMHINLMPKPERPETIERLRNAQAGAFKMAIYYLKRENKAQQKLIDAYERYVAFIEHRNSA